MGLVCLVGLVGPSLWDERGEEGADEGPRGGKQAWLRESSSSGSLGLVLRASTSFLPTVIILHALIHQTFLGCRCEETIMVTETEKRPNALVCFQKEISKI